MKKIIGIILLIIAGLNLVTIAVRGANGDPAGSPFYIVVILSMLIGGAYLLKAATEESNEDAES